MNQKNPFIGRPNPKHAPTYVVDNYFKYTEKFTDVLQALEDNQLEILNFLATIPETKWEYKYAVDKWTIKGVLSHIIDTERIFQYRALRLSRHDSTELPGYDENAYDAFSNLANRTPTDFITEFDILRQSSILLFKNMNAENLDFSGKASGHTYSARSCGWLLIGHAVHHKQILLERYLNF